MYHSKMFLIEALLLREERPPVDAVHPPNPAGALVVSKRTVKVKPKADWGKYGKAAAGVVGTAALLYGAHKYLKKRREEQAKKPKPRITTMAESTADAFRKLLREDLATSVYDKGKEALSGLQRTSHHMLAAGLKQHAGKAINKSKELEKRLRRFRLRALQRAGRRAATAG